MVMKFRGRVVDSLTGDGIAGVRVEFWDKNPGPDDYLGSATTVGNGSFVIAFDDRVFSDLSCRLVAP